MFELLVLFTRIGEFTFLFTMAATVAAGWYLFRGIPLKARLLVPDGRDWWMIAIWIFSIWAVTVHGAAFIWPDWLISAAFSLALHGIMYLLQALAVERLLPDR